MSHPRKQKEKPKKVKQALEALQETREMTEEVKAELLEHNQILKLHENHENAAEPAPETEDSAEEMTSPHTGYIKRPEDFERIARNTTQDNNAAAAPERTADILQFPLQQLFAFQLQTMSACMESWSDMMAAMLSMPARMGTGEKSSR